MLRASPVRSLLTHNPQLFTTAAGIRTGAQLRSGPTYRLIRAPEVMPRMVLATRVWSRGQAVAALTAAAGLLLAGVVGGVAVGARRRAVRWGASSDA